MRVAVFGVGGVGGYFGARLLQAGVDVSLVARGEHLRRIRENGLQVEGISGNFVVNPSLATDRAEEIGIVDLVIVGVKAWQIQQAAREMKPLVGEKTIILPLQNGVEAPGELAKVFGESAVLAGLCQIAALVTAPGVIRHAGIEPLVAFGELNGEQTPRLLELQQLFTRAGVKAVIPPDIHAALWDKFLFIAAFGALGAVTRAPAGVIRRIPQTRALLQQVMEEIFQLASAKGINMDDQAVSRRMAFIDTLPEDTYASMARDVIAGRPSELDNLIGAVVRLGAECRLPTPASSLIYACLLPQEQQARSAA